MKKTTSSKYPANLPISRNAYKRFINRIISVFADDPTGMSEMITAFDSYLTDSTSPIIFINPSMRVAFSFLRQDIDVAIERSRRARQRALARKASTTPSTADATITETSTTPEGTTTHIPSTAPDDTYSPSTTPETTTTPAIEAPAISTRKEESSASHTPKQDSTNPKQDPITPKQNTTTPHHHHRKNTRNTSTSHPSRHTTRKRKLKFNKPGQ